MASLKSVKLNRPQLSLQLKALTVYKEGGSSTVVLKSWERTLNSQVHIYAFHTCYTHVTMAHILRFRSLFCHFPVKTAHMHAHACAHTHSCVQTFAHVSPCIHISKYCFNVCHHRYHHRQDLSGYIPWRWMKPKEKTGNIKTREGRIPLRKKDSVRSWSLHLSLNPSPPPKVPNLDIWACVANIWMSTHNML